MHRESEGRRSAAPIWRSFGHAWDGLIDAARGQRNMRIHVAAGILAGGFAASVRLGTLERAVLVLCVGLVLAAEAFNTALEAAVDLHGGGPTEPARIAKDAAAGAVLLLAAASVGVFALLVSAAWGEIAASWKALLPSALGAAALAAVAWRLTSPRRLQPLAIGALTGAGGLLTALLGVRATCAACVALPLALFALAVAVARAPGAGRSS